MRLNPKRQRLSIITFSVLLLSFVLFPSMAMAWETPVVIAGVAGHAYEKPEIRFAKNGSVCIVYSDENQATYFSEIYMGIYDGKEMKYENVSTAAQYFTKPTAYEPDVEATSDGKIHVAWVVKDRGGDPEVHFIQYRYKNNNTWSNVVTLGAVDVREGDSVFDLRLGVSNNGNVHVILSRLHSAGIFYVAKYGDTVTAVESLGVPGVRSKHPDLALDNDYVHAVWMHQTSGGPYGIMHQDWENKLGSAKSAFKQVGFPGGDYGCDRVRMDLDSAGFYHLVIFFDYGVTRELGYTRELANGSISPLVTVSDPDEPKLYHWQTLEIKNNSMITTMQYGASSGGQGIFYNWNKNGVWGGCLPIPDTGGVTHNSVDLSADGEIAAVAYLSQDKAVMLVTNEPLTSVKPLEVDFTHPGMVFWGDHTLFNASQCSALNPDFSIVSYKWDFGDGTSETTASNTITHQYDTYGADVTVTLTITAATGETGTISKTIRLHALYSAILTASKKMQLRTLFYNRPAYEIQWIANSKNTQAGYPTITKYEIWRAPSNSIAATTGSTAESGRGSRGPRTTPGKPVNPAVAAINYEFVTEVDAGVSK